MLKTHAVKHFGTQYKLAKALGINQSAVTRWGKIVPLKRAMQLNEMTGGALKFNREMYFWNARVK